MKRIVLLVLLLTTYVFATDIMQIAESSQPLVGALEGVSPDFNSSFDADYIPEYGLVFIGQFSPYDLLNGLEATEPVITATTEILAGLAPTIDGLNPGEWASITATIAQHPPTFVTIRVQPDNPDSLEVWVDGVKR